MWRKKYRRQNQQQLEDADSNARQMRIFEFPQRHLPPYVDLRRYMTPVDDQADMSTW